MDETKLVEMTCDDYAIALMVKCRNALEEDCAMTRERCVLCGEMIAADEPDVVEVGGGLAHEECIAEREDDGLFGSQDPESAVTGRAAAFECSTAEIQRQRAAEGRRRRRA